MNVVIHKFFGSDGWYSSLWRSSLTLTLALFMLSIIELGIEIGIECLIEGHIKTLTYKIFQIPFAELWSLPTKLTMKQGPNKNLYA